MKRWKMVVLWIASILVVVAIGGAFAANYAIDKMLGSMSGLSAELLENTEGEDASENTTAHVEPDVSQNDNSSNEVVAGDTPVSNDSSSSNANNGEGGGNTGTVITDSDSSQNQTSEGSSGTGGYDPSVSTDKAKELEENVTLGDKAKVATVLTKRLSASDISTLQGLASGGLTVEEKKEARTLMLERLTEAEYNELIAIAAKHGLSQGKKYAEVSKE